MAHSEICPICKGKGYVFDDDNGKSTVKLRCTCHGCAGYGWIIVDELHDMVEEEVTDDSGIYLDTDYTYTFTTEDEEGKEIK